MLFRTIQANKTVASEISICMFIVCCDKEDKEQLPIACFGWEVIKDTVFFDNCSQHAASFLWDFDDGMMSSEENPMHAVPVPQIYHFTLLPIISMALIQQPLN